MLDSAKIADSEAVPGDKTPPHKPVAARLLHEAILPNLGQFAAATVCMVIVAISTAALAYLMDPVVNRVFVERNKDLLWIVGGGVFTCFAAKGVAAYLQTVLMMRAGQSILTDLQNRLFAHVLTMDLAFFSTFKTGALISRLTTDINAMRQGVSTAITGFGREALSLVFLVGVMFYQDWLLATIAFVAFPPTVIGVTGLGRRLRKVTANTQEQTGAFMTLIEQSVVGIRVVKAYGLESYEAARAGQLTARLKQLVLSAEQVKAIASPLMETLGGIAVTIVIVYGGWRVISGVTSPGAFFSFITALLMAYRPMKALANANAQIQEGLAGAERMFAVLDIKPQVADRPDAVLLPNPAGDVRFDNVSFSYGDSVPAVSGLSFVAPAGKTTALVGPSGSGKSTIFNLLMRFYDNASGAITIGGHDITHATVVSLRNSIAFVGQDVVLFDDTARANIRFGRPGASDAEVEAAATSAGAHEFILALPQGYDTLVGERGQGLSGGQRQRIAIARALLRNAPILLLDEATSALDTETERQVQAALETLMAGRTTLVIAHRLSTVARADRICVIDKGHVADSGSHAELLARGGLYKRLHDLQFAEP